MSSAGCGYGYPTSSGIVDQFYSLVFAFPQLSVKLPDDLVYVSTVCQEFSQWGFAVSLTICLVGPVRPGGGDSGRVGVLRWALPGCDS